MPIHLVRTTLLIKGAHASIVLRSMISCVKWVSEGGIHPNPVRYELSPAEEQMLIERQSAMDAMQTEEAEVAPAGEIEVSPHAFHQEGEVDPNMVASMENDEEDFDGDDMDSLSDAEDYQILPTDKVLVSCICEDDYYGVQVHVYDPLESNIYVHHDFFVPEMPVALAMVDVADRHLVAVGALIPDIELWDLNVIDVLEPRVVLQSHTGPVVCVDWMAGRGLLSGSIDSTVKLWDLDQNLETPIRSFANDGELRCLQWNSEAVLFASATDDGSVKIQDPRVDNANQTPSLRFPSEVVDLQWNPLNPVLLASCTDDGVISIHDARALGGQGAVEPVLCWRSHDEPTTNIRWNPTVSTAMATCSLDGIVKVWDLSSSEPEIVCQRDLKVGKLLCMGYADNSAFLLAAGGESGMVAIWDTSENETCATRFNTQ